MAEQSNDSRVPTKCSFCSKRFIDPKVISFIIVISFIGHAWYVWGVGGGEWDSVPSLVPAVL